MTGVLDEHDEEPGRLKVQVMGGPFDGLNLSAPESSIEAGCVWYVPEGWSAAVRLTLEARPGGLKGLWPPIENGPSASTTEAAPA